MALGLDNARNCREFYYILQWRLFHKKMMGKIGPSNTELDPPLTV